MGQQLFFSTHGASDPVPSDLEITAATKPMGIDASSLSGLDDVRSLTDPREGGNRQHQAEPFQRRSRPNQRGLQLKAIGFVVQKILFNVEAQAILSEGLQAGGLITDDDPSLLAVERASHRQVEGTETLLGDLHFVPESRATAKRR